MKKESKAILLRIYIGESDHYEGKPLYIHLLQRFRKIGVAGATVLKGVAGFGMSSKIHTLMLERLSVDLPVIIEVVDTQDNIALIKKELSVVDEGLVTEEEVTVHFYGGKEKE